MAELLPVFVNLRGRRVLLVGGGAVAASKLAPLLSAGALVHIVAPDIHDSIREAAAANDAITIAVRGFAPADLDDVWFVVAAATPDVNRIVADAAERRRVLVNAVDDPPNASAYFGGVIRRDGVTVAISTSGAAPGLTALLRQALDALLPAEIGRWVREARRQRAVWKKNGVPMEARRPLLLDALNRLYATASAGRDVGAAARPAVRPGARGFVSLVGAGPGDPALLTRAAVARLRAADLVLYDALVDERVLALARHAQRFFVGKRAGHHALAQSEIHAAMIRAAERGRRVVRLKGGDPFVFGRGGEEATALVDAGVPFEIVPGVTSAIAAPALAGIPVTHRGVASAFVVVSGHDPDAFAEAVAGVGTHDVTIVVLMGMANRAALAATLVARGWHGETPTAVVQDASREGEHAWRGTLRDLASQHDAADADGPATLVIGGVAALDLRAAEPFPERTEKCL